MKFHYEAYDKMGQQASDVVEAANRAEAEEELRRRGLYVTSLSRGSRGKGAGGKGGAFGRSRRLKNLAIFCRQLYVLVSSGTPVMEALSALERQVSDPSWRRVIHAVRVDVEKGASLQEAMEKHPVYFDSVVRSMVAAGESGGNLVAMLDRLGTLVQSRLHVRKTVIGAMVYPVLLVGLAGAVMAVMLAFVVPRFAGLFEMLEVPLPPSTKVLITASDLIKGWWWAILIVLGGGVMGVKFWLSSPKGRRMVDTVLIRMPQLGTIVKSFAVARIVRLLGVLLDSRVPLIEALQLTRAGLSNSHYVELMTRAEDAVLRGDPVSLAFADEQLVSPSVYEAIRSGENSGQVGPLLLNLAGFLEEENEVTLRSLTSIIEPVILILMGLIVGAVAVSMFMPLFDLTATTGA